MTIYQVTGISGLPDFFVPDQATADTAGVNNPNIGSATIGTEADAQTKLAQNQTEFLAQNAVRFSICLEVVDGNDTTWREALDTDADIGIYKVFNTFTGQYTEYPTLTQAKAANESLKQEVLVSVGLGAVTKVDALPKPPAQPKSIGTTTL